MLRITAITNAKIVLKLEGRLVGPWVDELMRAVLRIRRRRKPLVIDVSGLTFADDNGEEALRWLHRKRARFIGKDPFSQYLFERLKIPLCSREAELDESGSQ